LALGLTFAAAASQAAVARFETTSFGYSVSNGALSWSASDTYQGLSTEAYAAGGALGGDNNQNFWGAFTNETSNSATGYSGATANATAAQTLGGSAYANLSSISPYNLPNNTSFAYGNQGGAFSLSEDGSVTFVVGWELQVDGATDGSYDSYANALMSFTAGNYDGSIATSLSKELFSFDSASGQGTASGLWTIVVNLAAGEYGFYDLTGTASAQANTVPEPGSLALMLGGLGALCVLRRRSVKSKTPGAALTA
jgi:hypothetical protein